MGRVEVVLRRAIGWSLCGESTDHFLSGLDPDPQSVVNNAKMWDLCHLVFLSRVRSSHFLTAVWILHVGTAIPNQDAAIHLVVQKTGPARSLAPDRRVAPGASGAGDSLFIQILGDRFRAFAVGELLEDAPNHGGFVFDNRALASLAIGTNSVAIAEAACGFAFEDSAKLTASRFLAKVFQLQLGHHAHDGNMNLCNFTDA